MRRWDFIDWLAFFFLFACLIVCPALLIVRLVIDRPLIEVEWATRKEQNAPLEVVSEELQEARVEAQSSQKKTSHVSSEAARAAATFHIINSGLHLGR